MYIPSYLNYYLRPGCLFVPFNAPQVEISMSKQYSKQVLPHVLLTFQNLSKINYHKDACIDVKAV